MKTNLLKRFIVTIGLLNTASIGFAQLMDDTLRMPTDGAGDHLFLGNPASLKPASLRGGVLVTSDARENTLNQDANAGNTITNEVKTETVQFASLVDLGAGAGLGLMHQSNFKEISTTSNTDETARVEQIKTTLTTGAVIIELTDSIKAAFAIRGLHKEWSIFGAPFMNEGTQTRYVLPTAGPGYGVDFNNKRFGASWAIFYPLRGKATIQGEEMLLVESGEILLDAFYEINANFLIGIGGKRWIHESDDRAQGTTASDNTTDISLYGMDLDQYIRPEQRYEAGLDYTASNQLKLRLGLSQQRESFHFNDLRRFNGVDVRQSGDQKEFLTYNKIKGILKFVSNNLQLNVGLGHYIRTRSLPDNMNGGEFKSTVTERFVTLDIKL